jgi:hypothetical protein
MNYTQAWVITQASSAARSCCRPTSKRFHKYMREIEGVDAISDEMRAVVEKEWPEPVA